MPRAYLKRHDITRRISVNSIANRTLISDETNNKIKDKAPAEYLADPDIIPPATRSALLLPHFIDEDTLHVLLGAEESLPNLLASARHEDFLHHREDLIIEEIRKACGIGVDDDSFKSDQESDSDEVAEDLLSGLDLVEDEEFDQFDNEVA